jgi:hypothetical protein
MTPQEELDYLISLDLFRKGLNSNLNFRTLFQSDITTLFYESACQYKKKKKRKYLTLVDIHSIASDAANNLINQLSLKASE